MPLNRIRKEDIEDLDIVDSSELISDGYGVNSIYLTLSCTSTTAFTSTIVTGLAPDGNGILNTYDHPVQKNDIVWITGTSGGAGDGYFRVDTVLTDTSFSITGTIGNSTGGTVQFRNPSGASKIGFDSSGSCIITHNTVQEALQDLDAAICSGDTGDQLTEQEHPTLRQLVHLADGVGGPFEGFATGAYREVTGNKLAPTKVTWYTSSAKTSKIVDKSITYNGVLQPTIITWQAYKADGYSLNASVTDTVTYNGIFELYRDRAIVDYNTATTGLNRQNHKVLRQLIHLADGVGGPFEGFPTGAYREVAYPVGKPFEQSVIWYDDNTKAKKIVEHTIVRNSINMPITITWKAYDVDGSTILSTVSDSIVYTNNIFEVSRTRTIT